jgi:hypothetical protein
MRADARTMAKADDPPVGRKPQDLQVQVHDGSRPVSDFPGIEFKREGDKKRDELESKHEENLRAGIASGEKRREEPRPNPITEFITNKLKRDPDISGRAMVAAFRAEAENAHGDGHARTGVRMSPVAREEEMQC